MKRRKFITILGVFSIPLAIIKLDTRKEEVVSFPLEDHVAPNKRFIITMPLKYGKQQYLNELLIRQFIK